MANLIGICNENDFYSNHYLTSIFETDVRGVLEQWRAKESAAKEYERNEQTLNRDVKKGFRTPDSQLRGYAGSYFKQLNEHARERSIAKRLQQQRTRWQSILSPLAYEITPSFVELDSALKLPVLAQYQHNDVPFLWIIEAHDIEDDNQDPLSLNMLKEQWDSSVLEDSDALKKHKSLLNLNWQDIISKHILTQEQPPRWILLLGNRQALLIDRTKWSQHRLLRFDFEEILSRKELETLKATSVLLHKDSVMPESGQALLENLDEHSHKHAFSVSKDLKYALRESIELLGNEASQYLISHGKAGYSGNKGIDAEVLSRECLRYMYRLLFLFYIEARPELEYAPLKSVIYLKGYSLETLRDIELVPLYSESDKKEGYINDSLNVLFKLIHKGYRFNLELDIIDTNTFSITPLDSHLFDPKRTPNLNKVVFSNEIMQQVLNLMSLSREEKGKKSRRGRISYSQLGINQLGAVYEALLSYKGFFAKEVLYEVQKKDEKYSELNTGYFVNAEQFNQYVEDEKVKQTVYEAGEKKTRYKKFEKGSFIYRMAGRDREKSASYYTPEVLTKSLVKYSLKELFKEKLEPLNSAKEKAETIIHLTICEPAMGSAAFLNEAINQLSEHYLFYKQQAESKRIQQDEYTRELQRVKMYIADNNVFGVDLNPVAVELAEVSLWLNAISSDAFVPWFGYQLYNGNSLIGARRQVFETHQLEYKSQKQPSWLNQAPLRLEPKQKREPQQIYHFLLGDNGMANYVDKVVKNLKPDQIKAINDWRKAFNQPWADEDKTTLQRLSEKIDKLWAQQTINRAKQRQLTADKLPLWPDKTMPMAATNMAMKDRLLNKIMTDGASCYQRLKMVMDYWCALWFWPIDKADELPDRWEYLSDIETLLDGYVQTKVSNEKSPDEEQSNDAPVNQQNNSSEEQLILSFADDQQVNSDNTLAVKSLLNAKGELNTKAICDVMPRVNIAEQLTDRYKYFHWELEFSDIFQHNQGFDLMLGNPPWLKLSWNEKAILGDMNPICSVRSLGAYDTSKYRSEILTKSEKLDKYLQEYIESVSSSKFIGSTCCYSDLLGLSHNLYKAFISIGIKLINKNSVLALIHQEGIYDEKESQFRRELFKRLKYHFQFLNKKRLFTDVKPWKKFSINIYGFKTVKIIFDNVANLHHPAELTDIYASTIKPKRVVEINNESMEVFKKYFSVEKNNTSPLPVIYNENTINIFKQLAQAMSTVVELESFRTSLCERDLVELKSAKKETIFPREFDELYLTGPHINLANPFFRTPRSYCNNHRAYDLIDIENLPEYYLPRTTFTNVDRNIFTGEIKYCLVSRKMLSHTSERTLITSLFPSKVNVLPSCVKIKPLKYEQLLILFGSMVSLFSDFFLKTTGVENLSKSIIENLPKISSRYINLRCLCLVAMTEHYSELWSDFFEKSFNSDFLSVKECKWNSIDFSNISKVWDCKYIARNERLRRWIQIEIDVFFARTLNVKLNDLIFIYKSQFDLMNKNEKVTWFDQSGKIIYSESQTYLEYGLKKHKKKDETIYNVKGVDLDGCSIDLYQVPIGWEDIKDLKSGVVSKTFMDDTVPNGPIERTIEYHAPFDRCDREQDYKTVWAEFERRFAKES